MSAYCPEDRQPQTLGELEIWLLAHDAWDRQTNPQSYPLIRLNPPPIPGLDRLTALCQAKDGGYLSVERVRMLIGQYALACNVSTDEAKRASLQDAVDCLGNTDFRAAGVQSNLDQGSCTMSKTNRRPVPEPLLITNAWERLRDDRDTFEHQRTDETSAHAERAFAFCRVRTAVEEAKLSAGVIDRLQSGSPAKALAIRILRVCTQPKNDDAGCGLSSSTVRVGWQVSCADYGQG